MKDTTEAFAVLKAIAERERPEIVSFGDSETMHATGIVGWLRGDGRWKLLDGFDPAMSYPERLEIRRQALMSDLFITGVNAISMEGSLHWLDKVGNRIAPVAFGPRKVVIPVFFYVSEGADSEIPRRSVCPLQPALSFPVLQSSHPGSVPPADHILLFSLHFILLFLQYPLQRILNIIIFFH